MFDEVFNLLPTNNTEIKTVINTIESYASDGTLTSIDYQQALIQYDLQYIFSWILLFVLIVATGLIIIGFFKAILSAFR